MDRICTNKTDRNGEIIYEGDVIEHENWGKFVVKYEDGKLKCQSLDDQFYCRQYIVIVARER